MTTVNPWIWKPAWAATGPVRLLCVPHAGGGPSAFFTLSKKLPAKISLWAAHLPGRESRLHEPARGQIQALTEPLWQAVADDQAEQEAQGYTAAKLILYGHSMGALLAFELARLLDQRGPVAPALLIVSGRVAPGVKRSQKPIHALPDADLLEQLASRYQSLPPHVENNPELLKVYLPTLRADMQALEQYEYQPGPLLNCPITVRFGRNDRATNWNEIAAWKHYTNGPVRIEAEPGGHFFPFEDLEKTVASLQADLVAIA